MVVWKSFRHCMPDIRELSNFYIKQMEILNGTKMRYAFSACSSDWFEILFYPCGPAALFPGERSFAMLTP